MLLNKQQSRHLKALAHHLKPTVTIGAKGLTNSVITEIDHTLASHELVKIKLPATIKLEKLQLAEKICGQAEASMISLTGRVLIVYRRNTDKDDLITNKK